MGIPMWMMDFLNVGGSWDLGMAIWELTLGMIFGIMTQDPETWGGQPLQTLVFRVLLPWSQGIGIALLNSFFLIGFYKNVSNIKENLTFEILLTHLLKLVIANGVILGLLNSARAMFWLARTLVSHVPGLVEQAELYHPYNTTFSLLDIILGGIFFPLIAIACSFMMLLTVYGRFLKLYLVVIMGPVALATLPGGSGINQTASAWIKSFLAYNFEIVVIAITLAIVTTMMQGGTEFSGGFTGMGTYLNASFSMILVTASVKGVDTFIKRTLGL